MAGKGGKGLLAAKTTAANKDKDKDKKRPISRSSRAGIQVFPPFPCSLCYLKSFTFSIFNFETFVTLFLPSLFTFVFCVKEHWVGLIDVKFSDSPTCSLTIKYDHAYGRFYTKGLRTIYVYTFKIYVLLFMSDHGFVALVARYLSFV